MVFGFAINRNGSSTFGVVNADTEEAARKAVDQEVLEDYDHIVIMSAREALSQFGGVAKLIPAE